MSLPPESRGSLQKSPLVIRAGYGIRFNGGLSGVCYRLAIQSPFVNSFGLRRYKTPGLTIENGFSTSASTLLNTYGVSRDYKPAMAQQWNAIAQYTLGRSYVVQLSYFGTKGTVWTFLQGPNRATPGPRTQPHRVFLFSMRLTSIQFDESIGNSIYHAGSLRSRVVSRGHSGSRTYNL